MFLLMIDILRYLLSRSGGFDRRVLSATVRNLKNRHETLKTSIRWLLQISSKRENKFLLKEHDIAHKKLIVCTYLKSKSM